MSDLRGEVATLQARLDASLQKEADLIKSGEQQRVQLERLRIAEQQQVSALHQQSLSSVAEADAMKQKYAQMLQSVSVMKAQLQSANHEFEARLVQAEALLKARNKEVDSRESSVAAKASELHAREKKLEERVSEFEQVCLCASTMSLSSESHPVLAAGDEATIAIAGAKKSRSSSTRY